ncbi:hypothetical protein MHK_003124 [Candidatus Magnetomorum sp. HK-1]|nr:hypothetical protein MHK_003124 [Candidatus Magnetomorum sp. HK-1]
MISINDIHLFDAEYMLISENYRNDFILNKINHKIKVIWLSNNSLQQKRWAVPSLVAGYYNMKYWDVDLKDGKISRKKLS